MNNHSNDNAPDWLKPGIEICFESALMGGKVVKTLKDVFMSEDGKTTQVHIDGFQPLPFNSKTMTPIEP